MANVYVRSGAGGAGTGADWANAYTTLAAALTAKAAGDVFFVAEDHAETQASAMTLASPGTAAAPCAVYCVDHAGSVPPVSADLRTTATITTTGANGLVSTGHLYCYGVAFNVGSGATNVIINLQNTWGYFKNCALAKNGTTAAGGALTTGTGSSSTANTIVLDNTTVKFGSTSDSIQQVGRLIWKNTPSAIQGATLPNSLFGIGGFSLLEGVDLSALGSGKTIVAAMNAPRSFLIKDCKLGASVTISAAPTGPGAGEILVSRTSSSAANYVERKYTYAGTQIDELTIVRTGGASDGATPRSRNIATTANSKWLAPFEAVPIVTWNATAGSSVTATIEGVTNAAALPTNDELWFDVEYLGDASTPLGSIATGTKADGLASGAALTASTAAWDSLVTARANSTAYSLGDVRKVTSNPGRIFFCTTAGTTASSEPGGYATAVDGDSVTDGGAVFRAAVRFKKSISFTPQQAGYVYAYIKAAKASTTWFVDPVITLS